MNILITRSNTGFSPTWVFDSVEGVVDFFDGKHEEIIRENIDGEYFDSFIINTDSSRYLISRAVKPFYMLD